MTDVPKVTCPSDAITTLSLSRTQTTVVERIIVLFLSIIPINIGTK